MTVASDYHSELYELAGAQCEGTMTADQTTRLEELVLGDDRLRRMYILYMHVHACAEERGVGDQRRGMAGLPAIDGEAGFGVRDSGFGIQGSGSLSAGAVVELPSGQWPRTPDPEPPSPTLSTTHYPLPTSDFVGSWAFSYMVATVIMGVAILGFWAYKITHHQHIAEAPSQSVPSDARQEMVFVGRITGMVDVKWSDDPRYLPPPGYAHVPLGRKYILDSGLLEITYDSGAKVILEGPCTYEVESTAGGYLALGKLTARVEKERSEVRGQRSDHYPLPTIHYPLFSVRTPTAVVTDLGTEFGVEVSDEGATESRVFRGSVKVQVVGGTGLASATPQDVVLRENESARVERGVNGDPQLVLSGEAGDPPKFVRRIYEPPKLLDLLDIVAGGRGTGNRRERGINPTNGTEDPSFVARDRGGDCQYRPVDWHKFIDGVFMPDGRAGPVRLDSAGHAFDGFPHTSAATWGSIWARAEEVKPDQRAKIGHFWVYAMGRGEQFMPDGRGLLGLHANVGITFSLEAIRRAYPNVVPSRFRAVAGVGDAKPFHPTVDAMADVWIFVDGRLVLERIGLRPQDGTVEVRVDLGPDDRFLTLVSTDGGNTPWADWVVFGDPVLQMASTEPENRKEGRHIEQ